MRDRPGRPPAVAVLGGLAVLAGFAALMLVDGVSVPFVLIAGSVYLVLLNLTVLGRWALPIGVARILNLVLILALVSTGAVVMPRFLSRPEVRVGIAQVAPFLILLVLLRVAQRRRPRDDWLLLVGAGILLGLASFGVESGPFLAVLLVGTGAGGACALLLLLGREERAGPTRRVVLDLGGRALRRSAFLAGAQSALVVSRLAIVFLMLGLVAFLAIPRAVSPEAEDEEPTRRRLLRGPWAGAEEPDEPRPGSRTGFRANVVLGDIGRIKQDLRIALQVSVYRDREPYELPMAEAYFRGQVHSWFDGRRWSSRTRPHTLLVDDTESRGGWIQLEALPDRLEPFNDKGMLEFHYVEQEVLLSEMPRTSALFALYRPWLLDIREETAFVARSGSVIGLTRKHRKRWDYEVVSLVPRAGQEDPWRESLSPGEREIYTQVPRGHERLATLAGDVVGVEAGPEEMARRLSAWLRDRCRYTLNVPTLDPRRPVENFVFDLKEGHCELFASAYAMMLRSVGIPCRLVTGLRGYELRDDGKSKLHIVRFSNAHAWVEAFFEKRGWVTLDATPADASALPPIAEAVTPDVADADPEPEVPSEPWDEWILTYDRKTQRELVADAREFLGSIGDSLDPGTVVGVIGGLAGLGALLLAPLLLRRRRARRACRPKPRAVGPGGSAVRRAYQSMLGLLAGRGIRRGLAETPREVARRAAKALPDAARPVRGLTALHQEVVYGEREAEREDGRRAMALLAETKSALRKRPA